MNKENFIRTIVEWIMLGGRRDVFWLILVSLASALLDAIGVGSVMPFVAVATNPDIIDRNSNLRIFQDWVGLERADFVVLLGVLFAIVTIISTLVNVTNTVVQTKFCAKINHTLSTRLLRKVLARPYAYFLSASSAEISALILSSTRRVSDGIVSPFIMMLAKGVSAIFILAMLFWADPFVALCLVVMIVPIYGLTYFWMRGRLNHIGAEIAAEDRDSYRFVNEALSGVKDLQILGRTKYVADRFERSARSLGAAQSSGALVGHLPKYLIEAVGVLMIVGVILWGLSNTREPGVAVSLAALYAYAAYRLLPAAQAIFGGLSIIRYNANSIEAVISELRGVDADMSSRLEVMDHGGQGTMICSQISLKNVTFSYPGEESPALDSVSLEIPRGSHIGIVGPSGSGKSTLLDVLVGLLFPERGGIYVDDRLLGRLEMQEWRSRIGYVPQSVFLSDASIAENIAFGIPLHLIDERRVRVAAQAAQLHEFIVSSLQEGYRTQVGERGIRLSGGQRQRLGIARAVYHDPELLILDEATNALDTVTEGGFMATIRALAGSRTVISVAHRLSTVRACDGICVISKGRVVAVGSYDSLEKESPDFQHLIEAGRGQLEGDE